MLDAVAELNAAELARSADPEVEARIAQGELAFRMQMSVPELADLSDEDPRTLAMYGDGVHKPGTYAANCLLARRLAERGVRFVQLYDNGWDAHGNLPNEIKGQCRLTDQATAALLCDLERRGMLEDTLVVWGGEFGRTAYCQGNYDDRNYGRDHHPRCFTVWLAGGGVRAGITWGETDELGYNVVRDPVHVHDLHATVLHLLGIDHEQLTFRFQGRRYRLTDVAGEVVRGILA
jgi:arylsulfatase A-like enzyme